MDRRFFLKAATAGGLSAGAVPALAEPRLGDPPQLPPRVVAATGLANLAGDGRLPLNGRIGNAPALSAFRLHYLNGDQHVRAMRVMAVEGAGRMGLTDQSLNSPFEAAGCWLDVPGALPFEGPDHVGSPGWISVGGSGPHGTSAIRLPGILRPGYTPVLSGFSFITREKADTQVQAISAGVYDDGTIYASLDNGDDIPFRWTGQNRVDFTLKFVLIPDTMIARRGSFTSWGRTRRDITGVVPIFRSLIAIRGFRFAFRNGRHHLLGIGINLAQIPEIPMPPRELVFFQDDNRDDPIECAIDFVELRETAP